MTRRTAAAASAFAGKVTAIDPDGNALAYSFTGLVPPGLTISTLGALNWAKPVKGTYLLTAVARDPSGLTGSGTISLTVR